MNRSKSWRRFPSDEGAGFKEEKRATSHPNLSASLSSNTAELRASRHHSTEDLRRKIVSLNKELETEKAFAKQLRREKSLDLKHVREEEQRRAASMQTELKTKLHKEKTNELSALKEQLHKDKEKEIVQIIKQKDDVLRAAQQSWMKEKDELRGKIRGEVWSEARNESRKEFDRERTRLEQEILDLKMQKKELEEAYKILQEADKRKTDEIRRIFHEHEIELEKFKRNSWQESRRQMGEIRQLLNIIEQLERKLGIDSGHINKLRMEKEGLYEELKKKTNTFDAWDSITSSVLVEDSTSGPNTPPPHTDPKYHGVSSEIRTLQRKNTELSSLVKKLDEKNQQLATKNAELLSELERNDKEARDKCKKLEKKNLEITQSTKKLESKNKALQEEITTLKKRPGAVYSGKDVGGKKAAVRPRGQGMLQTDGPEITRLKQQIKDQSKTIEELKQNLMEKERRIDLLKQRKKSGKKPKLGSRTSVDVVQQQEHDDAASGVSDVSSDISEMSSTDSSSDTNKLKKLTKELLALERAYALLQAQVGGTVDVEREEMERQQLKSDLIESQTRIHELERMMDNNAQSGSEDLQQLQHDNKILYQKLIAAESERDGALYELSKNTEDLRDLQDKKDLLEFELEEMSQMSFAGSEDEFASPRKMRDKENRKLPLSLEEVKSYLEDIENEKADVLTVMEIEALKQARTSLTAFPQKISHLEATEAVLRSKVKDLEERHLLDSQGPLQYDSHMGEPNTLSEVLELDAAANNDQTDSTQNKTDFTLLGSDQHFQEKELIDKKCGTELTFTLLCDMERMYNKFLRDHKQEAETLYHKPIITFDTEKSDAECMTDFEWHGHQQESASLFHTPIITFDTEKSDAECMTEFIWEDIVEIEETYQEFLTNIEGLGLNLAKGGVKMVDKRTITDLIWDDITALENKGKQLDQRQESVSREKDVEKHEQGSNTDVIQCFERESSTEVVEKHEVECNTDLTCDDMTEEERNSRLILLKAERLERELSKTFCDKKDEEIMTDIHWKDVVKQEEIVGSQDILVLEQEQKLVEYQSLKEENAVTETAEISIMTDIVWIEDSAERLERIVEDLVVKTMNGAVADVAGETIGDLQHCLLVKLSACQVDQQTGTDVSGEYMETLLTSNEANTSELTRLRHFVEERENRLMELEDELAVTDFMREEFAEREERYQSQIDELRERLSTERQLRQNNEIKLLEYEALKEADINRLCEDKSSMTDLVWVENSDKVLEGTAREIVERTMNKAVIAVANDIICDLRNKPVVTKNDMETTTDILDKDLHNLERDTQRNILELGKMTEVIRELQNELSKVVSEKKELEVMIDMIRKNVSENDKIHEEQVEILRKQIRIEQDTREADKMKLAEYEVLKEKIYVDKIVMTESIGIVERMVKLMVEEAKNEALFEVAKEDLKETIQTDIREMQVLKEAVKDRKRNSRLNELETTMSEIAIRENELQDATSHLREELSIVEQLQDQIEELKEQLTVEQNITVKHRDENRHLKGEKKNVVTVDEMQTCEKDVMTDMSWTEVMEVEEKYEEFRDNIQEIQAKIAKVDVEKNEVEVMTDLVWEDFCNREQLYKEQIEKMQKRLIVERERREAEKFRQLEYEALKESSVAVAGEEKGVMMDNVCIKTTEDVFGDIVRKVTKDAVNKAAAELVDEELHNRMENEIWNQSRLIENEQNLAEWESKLSRSENELQLLKEQLKEDATLREQQEQFYKKKITTLQELMMKEQDLREREKMKFLESEAPRLKEQSVSVWTEESPDLLEKMTQELVEKCKDQATKEVLTCPRADKQTVTGMTSNDIENLEVSYQDSHAEMAKMKDADELKEQMIQELQDDVSRSTVTKTEICTDDLENTRQQVECSVKCDKNIMTDMSWTEVMEVEEKYEEFRSNIQEIQAKIAKVDVEKNEVEVMTDLAWEDFCNREQLYKEQIEEMQEQLMLEQVMREDYKMRLLEYEALRESTLAIQGENTSVMSESVYIKTSEEELHSVVVELRENAEHGAIVELAAEAVLNGAKEDKAMMTEFSWKEIEYLEKTYREWVEELSQMKEDLRRQQLEKHDKSCMTEIPTRNTADAEIMTDLGWSEIVHLENSYNIQVLELQALKDAKANQGTTEEKTTTAELLFLETSYTEKMLEHDGINKQSMTDLSWQDVEHLEKSYQEELDNLEVLATSLNENEKKGKDQDVMTELKWDEVECQLEAHKTQINHLNGLLEDKRYHKGSLLTETIADELQRENMGQLLSVAFDSIEVMGNLQDEDIDCERLKEAECMTELMETRLISFEKEGVDMECMTELSHEDISTMEKVVMKQTERLENKVDESCMTDLLFDDIERLQKLKEQQLTDTTDNEHVQANISSSDLERGQDKKELEQFYRITDGDERQNAEDTLEPTEPRTSTRLTEFPFTEGFDDSLTREDSSLSRNADVIEQYTSTDITLEDILYFEDLEIKHHELLLKAKEQGARSSVDKGREKADQETSTDLTLAGLSYYENLEVKYHEMMFEKKNNQLEGAGMPSRGPSSTEEKRTTVKEFENLKRKYEKLLEEKERRDAEGSAPGMLSIDARDYENLNEKYNKLLLEKEQWGAARAERGLTSADQDHYLNMKEQLNDLLLMKEQRESEQENYENMKEQLNELLLEKEQWEGEQDHYENMKEQLNELLLEKEQWEGEQDHYENMKEQLNELLLEKEQWGGEQEHYLNMKEQLNELLLMKEQRESEQENYENMKEQLNELLLEKEQWGGEQNKQQQTSVDVIEYENMKEHLFQLLSEKELWKSVQSDQQDNENLKEKYNKLLIEKERWKAAQDEYENMKEQFTELLMEKEQWKTAHSKMALGPDDRKEYDNLKEQYNELLSEKEQLKAATLQNRKNEVGTSTDLTLEDFEYYENVELDHHHLQESHRQLTQEYEALCSGKNSTDKATGTDLSLDDIQRLQDVENDYKDLLLTQPHEGEDRGACTDMTMGRLRHLEEVESIHKKCGSGKSAAVGTTTDLALADLHYLEEVEAVHQQCMTVVDNDISSSKTDTSDTGVGTELTASVLEYLEEVAVAHEEIVREYEAFRRSVTKETEDANLMTEMTGGHLDSLEHVAGKSEELEKMALQMTEERRRRVERTRDSMLMTDLTLENLKNLETSDNVFTELRDRGMIWRLEQLRKPKQKYSTVTDLLVSSIEYLEGIERLYRQQETIRKNMREKSVETDMTQTDLKRMENLANNAVYNNKKIKEKVTAQTSQDLLDDRGRHGDARDVCTVEVGIQCELKDLLSFIREQHEQDGGSADTKWFFSELNKKSKEGFEPVEVVLRHGVRNTSTPEESSRRDHCNKRYSLDSKRHSSNMSLNLDYGWTSTSSLDISGLDKTPLRGSGLGRWDSPRVPLAQDETFDLSDIESAPSEESLHQAMQASGREESAVTQFDRYIMARKQSEKELLADIRENEDQEEAGEGPHQLKDFNGMKKRISELLKENEGLKIRNTELELLVAQKGDLSADELQLLKQKIQHLREAEERMEKLHDSNAALKDRINQLQEETLQSGPSTSRSARDNWSDMDPREGRTRLLLVQDWGLGESDLDSMFSAREGTVSPTESIETAALRRLLDEYAKSGPEPGVSQDIQTTADMVKLIDLSYDGTIPDYIAKELEKLKAENSELYQELLDLRKLKVDSRDNRLEEPIKASIQSKAESQDDWLTKLESLSDDRSSKRRNDGKTSKVHVKDIDELFVESTQKPKGARKQYSTRSRVKEPEVRSSRSPRDTEAAVQRGLSNLEAMDVQQRADTDDILDFEIADDAPPDFTPPPVPSEPPPYLPDKIPDYVDLGTEPILGRSPPRDSKALRAALRQKNYPGRITAVSESSNVQADEGQPELEGTKIPPALRTNQTSSSHRPPATTKPVPPPTLPKPKMTGRRGPVTLTTPWARSRESLNDEEGLGLTPRGYVRATASAINQGELDALGEKINFLEKQLKNKENMIRSMKAEASELEKQALLERREREIKILEEDVAFLKQENHKKERELLTKIGELNRKSYEADQWKTEANNSEKQRKRIEASYLNLQAQTRSLQGSDSKLSGLQSKYLTLEKENKQLLEKVKNLEKSEKEFKQLEYNISVLQNHLQDMESVEKERDDLLKKLKIVEDQRDDLLQKGRMVESERNDFLRNNKIMEMQRDELEQRYAIAHKNQMELQAAAEEMEGKIQDANNKTLDAQHERNFVQAQYNKLEVEKNQLEQRLAAVTQERNALETRLAELDDRSREYVKLEDGFHTLRLKAAELTRQRDDFEMQIPTLKAKVALLKKACKEKDEFIDKQNDEIRELRHAIATSTLDDLSKIRSYGYSPENFVKYSGKRDESTKHVTNGTGDAVNSRSPCKSKSRSPPSRMFVAIFDYDPRKASVSGCPESELTLKEGDELMVYGDMDSNGCYEAELNGVRGLVPGLYVEEVEDGPVHSLANGTNGHEKERTVKGWLTNGHTEPDAISSSQSSMSPRSSCPDTGLQRQCFVALYDYNPYQSCATGRPELELPLKKGDIMTVIGDMDANGYYKAEMDGLTGLVPSNIVEDVTSSSFLQTTTTTAPEQILGMLDNVKVPSPQRSAMSLPLPMPALPNAGPSFSTQPSPASIVPSGHTGQLAPMVTMISPRREQAIQPIFTPYVSPAEVHRLAAPISTASNKPFAKASQQSPRQQTVTSPRPRGITSQSSPSKHPLTSQPMTSPPQITSQVQRSSVQPVSKPKPRQSKALLTKPESVGHRVPPDPPSSLRVLRPVNHDAILLGWSLPDMDEFGRSNGVVVKGYKIYENGEYKMNVRSQFMTKALVDNLDLRYPIQFTIRTIGSNGSNSNDVSTTFTDTINNSRMSVSEAIEDTVGSSKQVRIYVALYDYDPMKSSPNTNPQYELKFTEGDILRVEDTSRKDGFYFGSLNNKKGLIPSNFVEEVAVAKALAPPSSTAKASKTHPL